MSRSKLDSWQASNIARRIANKAFAHLTQPLKRRLKALAAQAYAEHIAKAGLSKGKLGLLQELKIVSSYATLTVDFGEVGGSRLEAQVGHTGGHDHTGSWVPDEDAFNGEFAMSDLSGPFSPEVTKAANGVAQELKPVQEREWELAAELAVYMVGKSAANVIKSWPEAAGIVRDYFGMEHPNINEIPRPLEQLLSRHLLALPAPGVSNAQEA